MLRQQFRSAHLLIPAERFLRILSELNIVGRIGINKIFWIECQSLETSNTKLPIGQWLAICEKILYIVDRVILAKRYIKFAISIEAAKPVIAGAVKVIE